MRLAAQCVFDPQAATLVLQPSSQAAPKQRVEHSRAGGEEGVQYALAFARIVAAGGLVQGRGVRNRRVQLPQPRLEGLRRQEVQARRAVALLVGVQLEVHLSSVTKIYRDSIAIVPVCVLVGHLPVKAEVAQAVEDRLALVHLVAAEAVLMVVHHGVGPCVNKEAVGLHHTRRRQLVVLVSAVHHHEHPVGLLTGVADGAVLLQGTQQSAAGRGVRGNGELTLATAGRRLGVVRPRRSRGYDRRRTTSYHLLQH